MGLRVRVVIPLALVVAAAAGCADDAGAEYCNLGGGDESGGSEDPWLEVWHHGERVADGMTLRLTCTHKGASVFELTPYVGGYIPAQEWLSVGVEVDVEGFNIGPSGHLYFDPDAAIAVGCEESSVYEEPFRYDKTLLVLAPDELELELDALDGASGDLRVWHEVDGARLEVTAMFVVDVPPGLPCVVD